MLPPIRPRPIMPSCTGVSCWELKPSHTFQLGHEFEVCIADEYVIGHVVDQPLADDPAYTAASGIPCARERSAMPQSRASWAEACEGATAETGKPARTRAPSSLMNSSAAWPEPRPIVAGAGMKSRARS